MLWVKLQFQAFIKKILAENQYFIPKALKDVSYFLPCDLLHTTTPSYDKVFRSFEQSVHKIFLAGFDVMIWPTIAIIRLI